MSPLSRIFSSVLLFRRDAERLPRAPPRAPPTRPSLASILMLGAFLSGRPTSLPSSAAASVAAEGARPPRARPPRLLAKNPVGRDSDLRSPSATAAAAAPATASPRALWLPSASPSGTGRKGEPASGEGTKEASEPPGLSAPGLPAAAQTGRIALRIAGGAAAAAAVGRARICGMGVSPPASTPGTPGDASTASPPPPGRSGEGQIVGIIEGVRTELRSPSGLAATRPGSLPGSSGKWMFAGCCGGGCGRSVTPTASENMGAPLGPPCSGPGVNGSTALPGVANRDDSPAAPGGSGGLSADRLSAILSSMAASVASSSPARLSSRTTDP
mmetsp:Transcript_30683/g.76779  ORF Transcript_30683/g.76779 Transcript_30683/m.76779 type:complete len:329 (+) Transcript_30683:482-1468(+)